MKNLIIAVLSAALVFEAGAQEMSGDQKTSKKQSSQQVEQREFSRTWPAFFAFSQFPRSPDVVGLRLTIPFSTAQDSVTGIDLGFWGRSMYFEGLQFNVLRNDVVDGAAGFQFGIYNSIGRGEMMGLQVGLWNEALSMRGVQFGLVNVIGEGQGLQVGIINRAETLYGYQVGLINVIRSAEIAFLPVFNVGF